MKRIIARIILLTALVLFIGGVMIAMPLHFGGWQLLWKIWAALLSILGFVSIMIWALNNV